MNKAEGRQQAAGSRQQAAGSRAFTLASRRACPRSCLWLTIFCLLPAACCLLPAAFPQQPAPRAAADAPRGPLTYDSFKLLHTRNVFDPDRRPLRPTGPTTTTGGSRADYVALTGTLTDPNKTSAFFSGSRADFNKVLSVGDKIANATITEITSLNIVVNRDGKPTTVAVGQTVPLDAKSAPGAAPANFADVVNDAGSAAAGTATAAGGAPSAPGAASAAPGGSKPNPSSKEEIVRRMMERRQQDLK